MKHTVLLVSSFVKPWNNGWYYKSGFEKNGHEVVAFDPVSFENAAREIMEIVRGKSIDFILYTKDELPASVLCELRKFTKLVMWYPDPVIPSWLPAYVRSCDLFLTMSEGLLAEFRKMNPESHWLSQAFEPSFFEVKEITEKDLYTFSADIGFVGNLGSKKQYLKRRKSLERVIGEGVSLKWWGPRIPRKISTIPLILGKVGRSYSGKFVWGEEYAKVAKLSKIFLAFDSMPDIRKSMSARMYTAVGCGAFYMCQHVAGIEEVLEPDREIVTFVDEDEMMDKIRFYLKRDELRKQIADAGQKRVLRDHTYEVRIKEMISTIERVFK